MRRFIALVMGLAFWSSEALAYRPFDSTDAAVADKGAFEVELSPLSYRHDDDGTAWISPPARRNIGFPTDWEAGREGKENLFSQGGGRGGEPQPEGKGVLQEGAMQEKS